MKRQSGAWPREILQIVFMVMEISWLAIIFILLDGVTRQTDGPSLAWICWMYPAAYVVGRIIRPRRPRSAKIWSIIGLATGASALIFSVIFLLRPEWKILEPGGPIGCFRQLVTTPTSLIRMLTLVLGGTFIGLRGWLLAGRPADMKGFFSGFQIGVWVLVLATLPAFWIQALDKAALGLIPFFFFSGLAGLCLTRLIELSPKRVGRDIYWWLIVSVVLAGLVLLGGALCYGFVDRDLLMILLQPIFWLWEQLIRLLSLIDKSPMPQSDPLDLELVAKYTNYRARWNLGWVRSVFEVIFLGGTIALILAALYRSLEAFLRWLRLRWNDPAIAVESLETGFWDDLLALFNLVKRKLTILWGRMVGLFRKDRRVMGENESIRSIYRKILRWGAKKGHPRAGHQTPREYLETLKPVIGDHFETLLSITKYYILARYGPETAGSGRYAEVKTLWRRVRKS